MKKKNYIFKLVGGLCVIFMLLPTVIVKADTPEKIQYLKPNGLNLKPNNLDFVIDEVYKSGDDIILECLFCNRTNKDVNGLTNVFVKVFDKNKHLFLEGYFQKVDIATPLKPNSMTRAKLIFPKGFYNIDNIDLSYFTYETHWKIT